MKLTATFSKRRLNSRSVNKTIPEKANNIIYSRTGGAFSAGSAVLKVSERDYSFIQTVLEKSENKYAAVFVCVHLYRRLHIND